MARTSPSPPPGPLRAPREEDALALQAQAGSVGAFEALVARFESPLFHFLTMRTSDAAEAEEVCQDAFLRAWQQLGRYDPRWRFSTWLFTLARNLSVSRARTRSRERAHAHEPDTAAVPARAAEADPALLAETRDEGESLWGLAERVLKNEERSALWLRYGEEWSVEEIARVLGRPRVSVRVLLFRARERLARHLERPGPERDACAGQRACDTVLEKSGATQ
jgi:RNA polymerase sigma-70 factor (ECF subfamily)